MLEERPPDLSFFLDILQTLEAIGAPYMIIGAFAATVYGITRVTYDLVTSEAIIAEIERVLRYPRIGERYAIAEQDIARLVESLRADALIVPSDYQVAGVCADPDDDKFLACAVEAQADCIVTGDPDLLALSQYGGIAILKPHEFLERLRVARS
ncbi:MAG: putative toxin-antitoxin system toxin component, PIN family [Anaerolineae bacterium]|nr:putative toxin-antitoxin system toxin component, PIN family [Anaerolineae bacterium]